MRKESSIYSTLIGVILGMALMLGIVWVAQWGEQHKNTSASVQYATNSELTDDVQMQYWKDRSPCGHDLGGWHYWKARGNECRSADDPVHRDAEMMPNTAYTAPSNMSWSYVTEPEKPRTISLPLVTPDYPLVLKGSKSGTVTLSNPTNSSKTILLPYEIQISRLIYPVNADYDELKLDDCSFCEIGMLVFIDQEMMRITDFGRANPSGVVQWVVGVERGVGGTRRSKHEVNSSVFIDYLNKGETK